MNTKKFQALTKVRNKASCLIFFLAGWTAPLKLAVNGPYRRVTLYLFPLKTQLVLRPKNFNQTGTKRKKRSEDALRQGYYYLFIVGCHVLSV